MLQLQWGWWYTESCDFIAETFEIINYILKIMFFNCVKYVKLPIYVAESCRFCAVFPLTSWNPVELTSLTNTFWLAKQLGHKDFTTQHANRVHTVKNTKVYVAQQLFSLASQLSRNGLEVKTPTPADFPNNVLCGIQPWATKSHPAA